MVLSSIVTVAIYLSVKKCFTKKAKIYQSAGVTQNQPNSFNRLNSSGDVDDEEVDRVLINAKEPKLLAN